MVVAAICQGGTRRRDEETRRGDRGQKTETRTRHGELRKKLSPISHSHQALIDKATHLVPSHPFEEKETAD